MNQKIPITLVNVPTVLVLSNELIFAEDNIYGSEIIETIQDPVRIQNQYVDLVKSAINEMLLIIPTLNALKRGRDIGILELLNEVITNRRVNIRILSPLESFVQKIFKNKIRTSTNNDYNRMNGHIW